MKKLLLGVAIGVSLGLIMTGFPPILAQGSDEAADSLRITINQTFTPLPNSYNVWAQGTVSGVEVFDSSLVLSGGDAATISLIPPKVANGPVVELEGYVVKLSLERVVRQHRLPGE